MDRIQHKTLRNTKLTVSDTPRNVDGDGFVMDLTETEFKKCAGIEYCFVVVPAEKVKGPVEAKEIEVKAEEPKQVRKPGRPAKR